MNKAIIILIAGMARPAMTDYLATRIHQVTLFISGLFQNILKLFRIKATEKANG